MPSLHAGWALAVGAGVVLYARNVFLKAFGVLYPAAVTLTIIVTGNHYVFDAAAGALVMATPGSPPRRHSAWACANRRTHVPDSGLLGMDRVWRLSSLGSYNSAQATRGGAVR